MYLLRKKYICKTCFLLLIIFSLSPGKEKYQKVYFQKHYQDSYNKNGTFNLIIPKISLSEIVDYNTSLDDGINVKYYEKAKVLLGHSGIGYGVLFNRLDELKISDEIILEYQNIKIYYKVKEINSFNKGSSITILDNENYLYLITCDTKNPLKQWLISSKIAKIANF